MNGIYSTSTSSSSETDEALKLLLRQNDSDEKAWEAEEDQKEGDAEGDGLEEEKELSFGEKMARIAVHAWVQCFGIDVVESFWIIGGGYCIWEYLGEMVPFLLVWQCHDFFLHVFESKCVNVLMQVDCDLVFDFNINFEFNVTVGFDQNSISQNWTWQDPLFRISCNGFIVQERHCDNSTKKSVFWDLISYGAVVLTMNLRVVYFVRLRWAL